MKRLAFHLFGALGIALAVSIGCAQAPVSRLVIIFIIDGLRPDCINATDTPTIARLRAQGTEYVNSHSVFPTVTRLNTTALATGAYPVLNGIVGNSMFVAGVNGSEAFDTGDYKQLLKLEEVTGRAVTVETFGEILQRHGRRLVTLSSGSTGNGFLLNPMARHGAGVAIHGLFDRGVVAAYPKEISDAITQRFGVAPQESDNIGEMQWTDTVLRDYVLPTVRPDVVIDWIGPLDDAQHANGVGSPEAKDALRQIDASIARTLEKLEELRLRERTDVVIGSDHGFARGDYGVDVLGELIRAGLKRDRASSDVIIANQGPSLLLYLPGQTSGQVERLVRFLQEKPWVEVLFTRGGRNDQGSGSGTFSIDVMQGSHPSGGPDVVASLPWGSDPNDYGARGTETVVGNSTGPLRGQASGHGGLDPWVVHNTFIAWGADFKTGARVEVPVSLADVMPTTLTIIGLSDAIPRGKGHGRVLRELLRDGPPVATVRASHRVLTTNAGSYRATVEISTVDGVSYLDTGSRQR